MAHLGFNPQAVEPPIPAGLLPKGRYVVVCDNSEVKPNKKGTGHILMLVFIVTDGEFKKKKIFDYINIQNENKVAQRIGQQHLAGLCNALGITQLDNSHQLHGIPVEVEVGIQEAKDGWDAKNVIKGFIHKVAESGGIDLSSINTSQTEIKPMQGASGLSDLKDDDIPF
jgi:hypothetical protein